MKDLWTDLFDFLGAALVIFGLFLVLQPRIGDWAYVAAGFFTLVAASVARLSKEG